MDTVGIKRIKVVYAVFSILVIVGFLSLSLNGRSVKYTGEDLSANEEMTTFYTPGMLLHKGVVRVSVFYASDANIRMDFYGTANDNYIDELPATIYGTTFENEYYLSKDSHGSKLRFEIPNGSMLYISEIEISSDGLLYTDGIVLAAIAAISFAVLYLAWRKKGFVLPERDFLCACIIMALAVIAAYLPHLGGKLYDGNDLGGQLIRLEGVKDGISEGQFPVILFPRTLGEYGELGAMYPYLFLIIPALLRLLNVSILAVYDLTVFSICIAVVSVMYYCMRTFGVSRIISSLSAVAYLLAPAFIHGETDNGAILGAGFAYIFIPLVIAGSYHVLTGKTDKWMLLTIGFTGMLQSHLVTTLMMLVCAVLMAVVITVERMIKRRFDIKCYLYVMKAGLWCIPLNIWWLSIFFYYYIKGNLYIDALGTTFGGLDTGSFLSLEATGYSIVLIIFTIVIMIMLRVIHSSSSVDYFAPILILSTGILTLFSVTSFFPWEKLRNFAAVRFYTNTMQFPTRFYVVVGACTAMAFGIAINMLYESYDMHRKVVCTAMAVTVFVAAMYFDFGFVRAYRSQDNLFCTQITGDIEPFKQREYLPDGTEDDFYIGRNHVDLSDEENIIIEDYVKREDKVSFVYRLIGEVGEAYIELPMFYYPGYEIRLENGVELTAQTGTMNHMRIYLPAENSGSMVKVRFRVSPVWSILAILSFFSAVLFVNSCVKKRVDPEKNSEKNI